MSVPFSVVEQRRADSLMVAKRSERKWHEVTITLLQGDTVFVPGMIRSQLESLRSVITYRKLGRLHSRTAEIEGVEGRLLRLDR